MTYQNSTLVYAKCIQWQLENTFDVPVYNNMNRNAAREPSFINWQLRNVHQPVYTGQTQDSKGIDTPVMGLNVFSKDSIELLTLQDTVLQSLHGYSGIFGNPETNGFFVAKIDAYVLYNTYDDELGLHQAVIDCTLFIPTGTR